MGTGVYGGRCTGRDQTTERDEIGLACLFPRVGPFLDLVRSTPGERLQSRIQSRDRKALRMVGILEVPLPITSESQYPSRFDGPISGNRVAESGIQVP